MAIGKVEFCGDLNSFDRPQPSWEIFRGYRNHRTFERARRAEVVLPLAVVAALLTSAKNAQAVDVVNQDRVAHQVIVNRADGQSESLTVKAGQKLADVCNDCVVLVGNSSVEATGRMTVKIEGGKVSINSKR